MKSINALTLRQALGRILDEMDRNGPVLIEKGRRPRAVLISIKDWRERFMDLEASDERRSLMREILAMRSRISKDPRRVTDEVRGLRGDLA